MKKIISAALWGMSSVALVAIGAHLIEGRSIMRAIGIGCIFGFGYLVAVLHNLRSILYSLPVTKEEYERAKAYVDAYWRAREGCQ